MFTEDLMSSVNNESVFLGGPDALGPFYHTGQTVRCKFLHERDKSQLGDFS